MPNLWFLVVIGFKNISVLFSSVNYSRECLTTRHLLFCISAFCNWPRLFLHFTSHFLLLAHPEGPTWGSKTATILHPAFFFNENNLRFLLGFTFCCNKLGFFQSVMKEQSLFVLIVLWVAWIQVCATSGGNKVHLFHNVR